MIQRIFSETPIKINENSIKIEGIRTPNNYDSRDNNNNTAKKMIIRQPISNKQAKQ